MPERSYKSYKVLVGMEIHVQLATRSKMFTGAANGFGGEPNAQVDEVVLGLPGTLPVMNKRAVEHSIKVGLALGCQVSEEIGGFSFKSFLLTDCNRFRVQINAARPCVAICA